MSYSPYHLSDVARHEARDLGFSLLKATYLHDAPTQRDIQRRDEQKELADAEISIKKAVADADQALVMAAPEERAQLTAKRDELLGKLMQLKTGTLSRSEVVTFARAASEAASQVSTLAGSVAAAGGIVSAAASAEIRVQEMRGRDLLARTSQDYERRTQTTVRDAARYGVDVSVEQHKIDEAKRREKEALARGDIAGALDARIGGRDAHITAMQKIIDNPSTPEAAREEYRKRKEEEIQLREKEVQQRLQIEDAKLKQSGVSEVQRAERLQEMRAGYDQQLSELATPQEIKASRQRIGIAERAGEIVDPKALQAQASLDQSDAAALEDHPRATDKLQHSETTAKAGDKAGHGLPPSANRPSQPAAGRAQS